MQKRLFTSYNCYFRPLGGIETLTGSASTRYGKHKGLKYHLTVMTFYVRNLTIKQFNAGVSLIFGTIVTDLRLIKDVLRRPEWWIHREFWKIRNRKWPFVLLIHFTFRKRPVSAMTRTTTVIWLAVNGFIKSLSDVLWSHCHHSFIFFSVWTAVW